MKIAALTEILQIPDKRPLVVDDAVQLLDSEINSKKGIKGAIIKSAYIFIKTFKRNYIPHIMELSIDKLAESIEPIHAEFRENPTAASFYPHLSKNPDRACEALLNAMDDRITKANEAIQKVYQKFRPQAHEHIVEALPGLAKLIDKHTISNEEDI